MKNFIKRYFPAVVDWRNRLMNHIVHFRFLGLMPEEVFDKIYKENHWRDEDSRSGVGSNKLNSKEVINIINNLLVEYKVTSLLDIPCGDFYWMQEVNLSRINYVGGDIVSDLIANNSKHANEQIKFMKMNLLSDNLPQVDLILTRDCLVHFSYADIFKAIEQIKKSKSSFWLSTTFPNHSNYNIITGDWRPINLEASPFNLPKPVAIFSEHYRGDSRHMDKSLGLWKISDLS